MSISSSLAHARRAPARLRSRRFRYARGALAAALALCQAVAAGAGEPPPGRTLRVEIPTAETTLDPAAIQDLPSGQLASTLFEGLLGYDYLARPARLVPVLATALPDISADGRTLLFHLREDVRFADDPAFQGHPRPLRASDVVFTLTRLMDPVLHSSNTFLLEGKIEGLDALVQAAAQAHRGIDYRARIPGLAALDDHTLRIRLTRADPLFLHVLAQGALGIMAPEVVARYGASIGDHPVGTGPYRLQRWVRGSTITLDANPDYRERHWDFDPGDDAQARAIAAQMRGKRIPALPRIEVKVIEEPQSAWLAFQRGELDVMQMNSRLAPAIVRQGTLRPELAARGYHLSSTPRPEINYTALNLRDPVLGGMDRAHIALRRAVLMAQDNAEFLRVIRAGQARPLDYPIPPGVVGADPAYRSLLRYDPEAANALLDVFGYRIGADGWRVQPDGTPLQIGYWRTQENDQRDFEELFRRDLARIHLQTQPHVVTFGDLLKAQRDCQVAATLAAWEADYPDGDDFMQLFYSPNIRANNSNCFDDPEWDALYRRSVALGPGPGADALYHRMARVLEVDGVIRVSHARVLNVILQPQVLGFRKTTIEAMAEWPYLDLQ